jgi:hypothetical protein
MTDYGATATGFNRKSLGIIKAELEAKMITQFGPDVIQTAQSPLGQLNGLFADYVAQLWEFGEDVYQSYDPDQAEGVRLEILGRLRQVGRSIGETDASYRNNITNSGRARIDMQDLVAAVRSIEGVTFAQAYANDTDQVSEDAIPPASIALAVIGGDDAVIAQTMRTYIVPGISTYGNLPVSTTIDGFCRNMNLLRPIAVPVTLEIRVRRQRDRLGCPPPDTNAIGQAWIVAANDLLNGDDITYFRVRSVLESAFPQTVEVVEIQGERDSIDFGPNGTVSIGFIERATFDESDVTVLDYDG